MLFDYQNYIYSVLVWLISICYVYEKKLFMYLLVVVFALLASSLNGMGFIVDLLIAWIITGALFLGLFISSKDIYILILLGLLTCTITYFLGLETLTKNITSATFFALVYAIVRNIFYEKLVSK